MAKATNGSVANTGNYVEKIPAPGIFRYTNMFNQFMGSNCPPGPKFIPHSYVINLQKGGTLVYCMSLMYHFSNFGAPAMFYTVAHGSYGLIWLAKHFIYPDPKWNAKVTLMGAINSFLFVLGPYWVAPYLLISRSVPEPSTERCALACGVYILGVVMMMLADAHKTVQLQCRKGLVTNGIFTWVRNPNYTGEMLVYGGFAAMVPSWIPAAILGYVWSLLFMTNIHLKEESLSRYPGWKKYCTRAGMLLPPLRSLLRLLPWAGDDKEE